MEMIFNNHRRLKRFCFSIYTYICQSDEHFIIDPSNYPSNDSIEKSFVGKEFGEVRSYIHPTSLKRVFQSHVYSIPFPFISFTRLTCSFSNDLFTNVRILVLTDDIRWNCELFAKVNRCFPRLETLMICNNSAKEGDESMSVVTFDRLIILRISTSTHIDHIEQLLSKQYICLPRIHELTVSYEQLNQLTNGFTKDRTQFNCLQVEKLIVYEDFVRSEYFLLEVKNGIRSQRINKK